MIFNKCWSPLFDSCTKRSDIFTLICLKCFDIPLDLWYLDNFKEIGNVLGTFIEADILFLDIGIMSIGYIFVGIALRGGLVVEMTLQKIDHTFSQPLDYSRAPFRCIWSHKYGHVSMDSKFSFRKKAWEFLG